jgi:hypothetical protein
MPGSLNEEPGSFFVWESPRKPGFLLESGGRLAGPLGSDTEPARARGTNPLEPADYESDVECARSEPSHPACSSSGAY